MDGTNSGKITESQIWQLIETLNLNESITREKAAQIFSDLDSEGKGYIDAE